MRVNKSVSKKKALLSGLLCMCICVTAFFAAVSNAAFKPAHAQSEASKPYNGNYYFSDFATRAEAIEAGHLLNEEIMEEGVVLLKNQDNALPIKTPVSDVNLSVRPRISVFGKSSIPVRDGSNRVVGNIAYGGAGSGAGGQVIGQVDGRVDLYEALETAGFDLNLTLRNFYQNINQSGENRPNTSGINSGAVGAGVGYKTFETPRSSYTQTVRDSYAAYNDAAIILFSRTGGESFDLPRSMATGYTSTPGVYTGTQDGARQNTDHYMQLDQNETDLIKEVCENFDRVIVLINSGSQIEVGFLDDPGHYAYHQNIKAAMFIGMPGTRGLNGVARVINGQTSPSGKTTDTWARDFKMDPVWQNFGNNNFTNGASYSNGITNANRYVYYEEGIYLGYRYYETRGFTEGFNTPYVTDTPYNISNTDFTKNQHINGTSTTSWSSWYAAHVSYPFGHGLSYTTFSQEIIGSNFDSGSTLGADDVITVHVQVTNTGDTYAGKDIVQLYFTAPYTSGGIEKAHVVLSGFEKTQVLEPGESQTVTVTIKVRDMASYDWDDANNNGFKGWELDAGNYQVKIMRDANTTLDTLTYTLSDIRYETDEVTGYKVENLFDDVSEGVVRGGRGYLSRADFAATFPKTRTTNHAMTADILAKAREWWSPNATDMGFVADQPSDPWYAASAPTTGASNGLVLADMVGLSYDDPLWDDYLDQFVPGNTGPSGNGGYAEGTGMAHLTAYGGWMMAGKGVHGMPSVANLDGPSGWGNGRGVAAGHVHYCSDTILAGTYNKELAYRKGIMIGNEGLFGARQNPNNSFPGSNWPGGGATADRYPGWYAPSINIHRSPFSGRNFEYMSEDGYVSGIMAAEIIKGAMEKGVFCFVKHFALNDQELTREGILTWASEQSMREIYFRAFEIAIKEGKSTAVMSAFNRLGPVWAGGDYRLLTTLLRNEWGFRGTVVTDFGENNRHQFMNPNQMLRAGGDLLLARGGNLRFITNNVSNTSTNNSRTAAITSATTIAVLRQATKNIAYTMANSNALNSSSVVAGNIVRFESKSLAAGIAGDSYTESIAVAELVNPSSDPNPNITYTLRAGSSLPAGLTLASNGTIAGTPAVRVSNHRFTVVAAYRPQGTDVRLTAETQFSITILGAEGGIVYERDGTTIQRATYNKPYTQDIGDAEVVRSDGGIVPPTTYALKDGSLLPEGLSLSSAGVISGTPVKICAEYRFTVVVRATGFTSVEATLTVSVFFEAEFADNTLSAGVFGVAYFAQINGAESTGGAETDFTYSIQEDSALPRGLSLTPKGYITGVPTETVTNHTFVIVAQAPFVPTQEAVYTITIGVGFNESELADGKVGVAYDGVVFALSSAEITYSLKAGSSLPEGLTLAANGTLTGTPVKAGNYTFTIVAQSEGYVSGEATFQLFIEGTGGSGGSGCGGTLVASDGFGGIFLPLALLCAAAVLVILLKGKQTKNFKELK
ncbi:MAG: putative Ig domain-containing protein [Firmicutes bacterium]|nr:putative Ig domain-containing protein [Bacillota bacterium]